MTLLVTEGTVLGALQNPCAPSTDPVVRRVPTPALWLLLLQHLPVGPLWPATLGLRWGEVPIHWIEELLRLLVGPIGINDKCQQGQPNKEQGEMRQVQAADEAFPVPEAHPPHVVGEDHAAVKHVDHQPLVELPEQCLGPAGL